MPRSIAIVEDEPLIRANYVEALTRADYNDLGGVVGALRSRADAEYEALDEPHRAAMQRLMLRMVGGGTGSLAKRRVSDAELAFPDPAESARGWR